MVRFFRRGKLQCKSAKPCFLNKFSVHRFRGGLIGESLRDLQTENLRFLPKVVL